MSTEDFANIKAQAETQLQHTETSVKDIAHLTSITQASFSDLIPKRKKCPCKYEECQNVNGHTDDPNFWTMCQKKHPGGQASDEATIPESVFFEFFEIEFVCLSF
jgi:hypothetical protein